jgi:hypothetical protein
MRLFVVLLALAVAASAQATAFGAQWDARMTRKAEANEGCPAGYFRGAGGNCVMTPTGGPYKPDPYWTPCDYSLGPQYPEGCGD